MIKKIITGLVLAACCTFWVTAAQPLDESRLYREQAGDKTTEHRFTVETTPSGHTVTLVSKKETVEIRQIFELDDSLATHAWQYSHPAENTKVAATRRGNRIVLSGRNKGKEINKTFKVDDLPWNQSFNLGLEKFALTAEAKTKFWAIGTEGPGRMKITRFSVKDKREEMITVNGRQVEAIHVKMSLTGLLALFWKGHYWYRKSDGTFVKFRGKGSGSPTVTMELLEQTPYPAPKAAPGPSAPPRRR